MADFTPTQGRYLSYIHAFTAGFGFPPSELEIAEALGVSSPSVNQMVKTLEKKGLIRRQPGVPRTIHILVASDTIPKWKGKRLTTNAREWASIETPAKPNTRQKSGSNTSVIYRFKIILEDTDPVIWRRIETQDVTLEEFHELIQTAMGWTNSHMHQFEIAEEYYTHPNFIMGGFDDFGAVDYSGIRISELVSQHGTKLRMAYEYDFGDSWQHKVALEKILEADPGASYPRCTDGARACPPEDIGGVYGFEEYVKAVTNKKHKDYAHYLEWNGPFDPEEFDATSATQRMRKGLPSW